MRHFALFLITLLCGCSVPLPSATSRIDPAPNRNPASLNPVKIVELEKLVVDQKGKVVVLDIWFLGCAPCVKKFPSFVELHNTYVAEGLVCMSVDIQMDENRDEVRTFLKRKGAEFTNLIIEDTEAARDAWQERNDANATPSYVVYNRKGDRVSVSQSIKPEEMTALVKKLLDEK